MSTAVGYTSKLTPTNRISLRCSQDDPVVTQYLDEVLESLLEDYNYNKGMNRIKVCWNINEFVQPLFAYFTKSQIQSLKNTNQTDILIPDGRYFKKFHIRFWEDKVLRIYHKDYTTAIYSLYRYYATWPEWDGVVPKDEFEVKDAGDYVLERLNDMQIFKGKKIPTLTSPIAIYEQTVMRHMDMPNLSTIPKEATEAVTDYAWNCVSVPWNSAYQLGHWNAGECWDYDLIAAFQSEAAKLYNTRYATYEKSDKFVKGAHWGYLKGKAKIDGPISPIILEDGSCLVGEKEVDTTLDVVKCIYKYGLGSFELYDGWFLTFKNGQQPFKIAMDRLFNERNGQGIRKSMAKQMGASFWGKFVEYHPGDRDPFGDFTNFFYGAQITNGINIELVKFILDNNLFGSLIHISTDGALLDTEAIIPPVKGIGQMGQMRLDSTGPALVAGPSRFYLERHKQYAEIMNYLEDNPRRSTDELIDFLVLDQEQNRQFDTLPKNGKELLNNKYSSKALTI